MEFSIDFSIYQLVTQSFRNAGKSYSESSGTRGEIIEKLIYFLKSDTLIPMSVIIYYI